MIDSNNYQGMPPFVDGSDTSRAAAYSMEGSVGAMRACVLRFIVTAGSKGATDEEVQNRLPMNQNTQRPRRRELQLSGYVERSDIRRPTRSGSLAYAYVATSKGIEWVSTSL
jgi:hypothetical protein